MNRAYRLSVWPRAWATLALWLAMCLPLSTMAQPAAELAPGEVTLRMQFWIDESGKSGIEEVAVAKKNEFKAIEKHRSFALQNQAALWMRLDVPAMNMQERWYLQLSSGTFIDRASLFQRTASGEWNEQRAGDYVAVKQWAHPDQTPVFQLDLGKASTVWVRLENYPASIAPRLQLISEDTLTKQRHWTFLLLGCYFGLGLLVLFLGIVHARLYADRAFVAYSGYVAFMLFFQLAFTDIGGLFFWPESASWNNAAPAIFMLLLTACGIWFVREACVLARHNKWVDKTVMAWVAFGVLFAFVYALQANRTTFLILNLYGLISVVLSITLCLWVWRRGEKYGFLLFLGFLPVHLGYPFPALRSAGLIADHWLSQYAVLIGSAIEIPLLLYVLHLRAKEFNENRARMRAMDHTDPLTGLAITPVLTLRLRDAMRRYQPQDKAHALILVELANHAAISARSGRLVGDRALVVSASCLQAMFGMLDTVCRIDDTRFAVLIATPLNRYSITEIAQKIITRGLSEKLDSEKKISIRFRVVTSPLYPSTAGLNAQGEIDLAEVLKPLVEAMDDLADEPKKFITHLTPAQKIQSDPALQPV